MLASLNHVDLRFGPQEVLKDVTWAIQEGECWGVIGRNGAGKSTVFKLLLGQLEADAGTVVKPTKERGIRMGHYAQDLVPETEGSVLEEALAAFGDIEKLQHEMRDLEHRMGEAGADLTEVMERYQKVTEAFEHLDGFTIRARAESILQSLGFSAADFERPVETLSGGQKSRVMLAKAILKGQDLLLLDEPTNHLDLPSLRWLEGFIQEVDATVAIISHDRYFLDKIATEILELEQGRSRVYEGNYSEFMEKKEQELELLERHYEQQQAYIKNQEEYIRRNIAGQNTKQARGRRTHLSKLNRIQKPLRDRRKVKFLFPETQRSGDVALVLENASVGWGGQPLYAPLEQLQVKRGQKMGIVGLNGTGKSTLLKAIAEEIPFITGQARLGSQVKVGYFDQHHRNLDPRNTVFQQIHGVTPQAVKQDVLGFLAKFQFRGDEVDKPVTALSGGERARLSIATLIRHGVNLLLLDEPTNHMDIPSMEAMEDTILSFTGAAIVVTHDRYLLGRVADSLLRIHEGKAEFREGGYEDHQAWVDLDLGSEDEAGSQDPDPPRKTASPQAKPSAAAKPSSPATKPVAVDKDKQRAIKRFEKQVAEAEAKVADLEVRLAELQKEMATMDPTDWQAFSARLDAQKALEADLAYAMSDWEGAQGALEDAQR
ncbi:MAG: ATP-binding cassette domain-containing protein [Holophagaceae bacterium]|jgi:ATP-binding cassette subfamily F protein 3|uniref:ATP-binding cassette domain-containing protein n=1 Tax=Candidatus Geothrix odensensis TaxID=2954440 RepID=A0A936F064_9BACT|nr:ATP-binding cassette domain-containing protein [Candidatus Geothrix odensensis]MBK8790062.1 ATP-binding cassette domain-containing protein [Holophagaceae bacterium]